MPLSVACPWSTAWRRRREAQNPAVRRPPDSTRDPRVFGPRRGAAAHHESGRETARDCSAVNPDRRINKHHTDNRRRGAAAAVGSVPPSAARRRALSIRINACSPSRMRAAFRESRSAQPLSPRAHRQGPLSCAWQSPITANDVGNDATTTLIAICCCCRRHPRTHADNESGSSAPSSTPGIFGSRCAINNPRIANPTASSNAALIDMICAFT